jgi:structural maintenance of chromosome 2
VIGGRNKYLINGHVAQPRHAPQPHALRPAAQRVLTRLLAPHSRVQNLFHSVQLNVNNPHFLIMQGRITKVLNMKPPEILSMLEEARGSRRRSWGLLAHPLCSPCAHPSRLRAPACTRRRRRTP